MTRARHVVPTFAGAVLAAAVLAACGSASGGSTATSAAGTSTASAAGSAATTGRKMTADLTEFHIALTTKTLSPGTYSFAVKNDGTITHALSIDGPGVQDKTTGDMSPGSSATLTVTLQGGSYDFFCPVGDHKSEGMDETVKVG